MKNIMRCGFGAWMADIDQVNAHFNCAWEIAGELGIQDKLKALEFNVLDRAGFLPLFGALPGPPPRKRDLLDLSWEECILRKTCQGQWRRLERPKQRVCWSQTALK